MDQHELLWPCAMLKVLQLHGTCLHKVYAHSVLPVSVEVCQAKVDLESCYGSHTFFVTGRL